MVALISGLIARWGGYQLDPAPQRRHAGMSWTQFLKLHWDVLAATDFFTVEVATWHGLVTYYVLVVMELATRRVHVAGITPHPTAAFMQQLSLSRFMVYCASPNRRHYSWRISSSPTCRIAPPRSWI